MFPKKGLMCSIGIYSLNIFITDIAKQFNYHSKVFENQSYTSVSHDKSPKNRYLTMKKL